MNLYLIELYRPASHILEETVKVYVMSNAPVDVTEQCLINKGKWKGFILKRTLELRPNVVMELSEIEIDEWQKYIGSML